MTTLRESAQAVEACVWLHVPTGVRYRIVLTSDAGVELENIAAMRCRQVLWKDFNNSSVWERQR
ncbi:Uncharacterised protein [Pseudomonas luteola]|uniref:Uncharacterized protein n=1 Tax=Pseudomonas luteola TaxID=47886 RepID=A0A2X2CPR0_PSELU|nr:hypothetical protein EAW52_10655 [Pseudomonas sp. LTJR-52]SPZ07616.1 Uncharacterised protein [Pseudomonas luteola]